MAPRQPPRRPDQDEGNAEQRRARDVELARDRELRLVEALGALPGEVRVAEHHPTAVVGRRAAEAVGVGADVGELGEGGGELGGAGGRRAAGQRRRSGDSVDRDALAGQRGQLVEAPVDVHLVDRAHPRLAAARQVGELVHAGVAQVGVVAGDVAADTLLDLGQRARGRRLRQELLDDLRVVDALVEEVGVEVVDRRSVALEAPRVVGPEEPRALGADGDVAVGDLAQVVLRERVRVAVGQAREVVRVDVRDPVRGAPDRHVHGMRGGRRGKPCRDHDPCQDLDPSPHRAPRYPA